MQAPPSPRQRHKASTRQSLLRAASRRFAASGYAATTIEEICAEAGVGRRTFFRYFPDKEALAFPHRRERQQRFLDLLNATPAQESPFTSLRRIAQVLAREHTAHRERLLARQRLIETSPELLAREHEIDRDWEAAMAQAFRERAGDDPSAELRARVIAGATIGVIRATLRHWYANACREDLARLGAEALDCLERGFLAEHRVGP
jgi:AcrR family transcriptional regulator